MKVNSFVQCSDFPCLDIRRTGYLVPAIDLDPARVSILLISEAAPQDPADDYYAGPEALFARTTLLAFQDAGAPVKCMQDILDLGVYLTTAVKCAKTGPGVARDTIQNCARLLEKELDLFPNVKVYLLMGDVAIQAVNLIAKRNQQPRVIPAGSTYKIRGGNFSFRGAPALPSYVQAGPAFFVEKSKRRIIAEDIKNALLIAER
ncbi:MAG TPA: uracil-DNA glycosylase family protein [Anaerolineales bacterium]|nr:uracil-DNA glycosylase family protein [Anaerolineales bacterium]